MNSAFQIPLTVDGVEVSVAYGTTILDAAKKAGVHIPTLCYMEGVSKIASCRVCVVEVEGIAELVSSCNTLATYGMVVHTNTPRVEQARRFACELLIADHGLNTTNRCFGCVKNESCELQSLCYELGVENSRFAMTTEVRPVRDSNPFLLHNPNLCIRCQRCVGACVNTGKTFVIKGGKQGVRTAIEAPFDIDWEASQCKDCYVCTYVCPTGALVQRQ